MKSFPIWSFSGPYSLGMQENMGYKNSECGHFLRSDKKPQYFIAEALFKAKYNYVLKALKHKVIMAAFPMDMSNIIQSNKTFDFFTVVKNVSKGRFCSTQVLPLKKALKF